MPSATEGTCQAGRFWWDRARPADLCPLRAVIFGIDALADFDGHRIAVNAAFAAHGLDVVWDADHYRRLLKIPDERRRIAADLRRRGFGICSDPIAAQVFQTKTALFEDNILDADITPRPGLVDLVMSLFVGGVWIAVVSPGRRAWVQPLVRQLIGDGLAETIVTGDDLGPADRSVHALALWELGITPEEALAVEGSAAGLHAATALGVPTLAVMGAQDATRDRRVAAVRTGYDAPDPLLAAGCARLHTRWWTARKRSAA